MWMMVLMFGTFNTGQNKPDNYSKHAYYSN
jgi:hypothetical protein